MAHAFCPLETWRYTPIGYEDSSTQPAKRTPLEFLIMTYLVRAPSPGQFA